MLLNNWITNISKASHETTSESRWPLAVTLTMVHLASPANAHENDAARKTETMSRQIIDFDDITYLHLILYAGAGKFFRHPFEHI